ncbi:uncharacterized protein LOC120680996 [Panicum virgatum]|uniref:uncharacterized protein LOC120680996 n=1 Tax=Panicum virgatum TaxID=38727 RepID=UPI0019D60399|nr:uncharacterized protein LOC120680996 [Panicum virgatum]
MAGQIRDKGCPKAHCLKRPTDAAKVLEYWSPAPLLEGDPSKDAAAPVELRQPAEEVEFSSDSSVGRGRRSAAPRGRRRGSSTEGSSSDVSMLTSLWVSLAKSRARHEEEKEEEEEASNRVSPPLQDVEMQDPHHDEGAARVVAATCEVPAIEVVRTTEVPANEIERTQAEPSEGVRTPPAEEEAKEDESLGCHLVKCTKVAHEWDEIILLPLSALVELSEQAAQELAEGSTAIGRVVELEARVAELEAQGRQMEAERVKAEVAQRKEERELEACTKANEELQKLREVAEAREAATEEKLRLEQQARREAEDQVA